MKSGTKKNSQKSITSTDKQKLAKLGLQIQRKKAKHGDFFFAEFTISNNDKRKSPVFIVSNSIDNKDDDVVICSCTKQPAKSQFDVEVQLKYKTCVRTNKLYTIHRDSLLFKISQTLQSSELKNINDGLRLALDLNEVLKVEELKCKELSEK